MINAMLSAIYVIATCVAVVGVAAARPPKTLPLRVRSKRQVRVVRRG